MRGTDNIERMRGQRRRAIEVETSQIFISFSESPTWAPRGRSRNTDRFGVVPCVLGLQQCQRPGSCQEVAVVPTTPPWRGGGDGPTQEQKPHFKVALGCPHLKFVSAAGTTRTDSDSTYTTSGSSRYQDLCADKTQSTYPLITFLTARTAVHFTNQLTHQHVFLRPKPSIQPIKSPRLKAVISPWEPASKSQNAHSL